MKKLILLLVIVCLFSCSKEKIVESVSGTWTIVETNTDTGGSILVQTYPPTSELTLEFGADGRLVLTGINPGQAMSPLWEYDRYEVQPDNIIRFFQSAGNNEITAYFTVNGELFLNYLSVRCPQEEKFVRVK